MKTFLTALTIFSSALYCSIAHADSDDANLDKVVKCYAATEEYGQTLAKASPADRVYLLKDSVQHLESALALVNEIGQSENSESFAFKKAQNCFRGFEELVAYYTKTNA